MVFYDTFLYIEDPKPVWRQVVWEYDENDKRRILDCCECGVLSSLERRERKLKEIYPDLHKSLFHY